MANDLADIGVASQLQDIKQEVVQVKGLSELAVRLHIEDAKNRGSDLIRGVLDKFTLTKAKVYLLVDGFRSTREIARIVGIKQPTVHHHLDGLVNNFLVDRVNPGSPKAVFKKSAAENTLGLSTRLKKEFDLSKWLDEVTSENA